MMREKKHGVSIIVGARVKEMLVQDVTDKKTS
jgi:hypothetical protein